jgi:hypothetical protein
VALPRPVLKVGPLDLFVVFDCVCPAPWIAETVTNSKAGMLRISTGTKKAEYSSIVVGKGETSIVRLWCDRRLR